MKAASNTEHLQFLNAADLAVINEYLRVMSPIAAALDRLQGEQTASQGYIMPTLISMKYKVSALQGGNLLQSFRKTALDAINKRFSKYMLVNEVSRSLVLAAVSIPQFKTSFIESVVDQRIAHQMLVDMCISTQQIECVSNVNHTETAAVEKEDDFFISFANTSNQRRSSLEDSIAGEVTRYINDDRKDISILNEYPAMKSVYLRFNTTLSSSAPIERVFSHSKLIFRPQRNRLSSENFERSLLLSLNEALLAN